MMLPRTRRRLLALSLAVFTSACSDATAVVFDGPVDLAAPWTVVSPGDVDFDTDVLDRALDQAEAIPRFRSLTVIRRGRMVVDRYFHGTSADELADVRSVTKSVVSTLTALALDQGYLTGLDQPIGEIIGPPLADLDEVEATITIRDLLTMSGGWDWQESGAVGYNEWITSGEPIAYLLEQPHAAEPGTTFAYNSAAVHLLGIVLEEAIGESLPAFARRELFTPLGVGFAAWEQMDRGRVNGGSGIDLQPRDLARIGQLYLQDGWSGSERILPGGWVDQATSAAYPWRSDAGPVDLSYGFLWWTDEDHPGAYLAWGYGGQFIYVSPPRELVVVATTAWWLIGGEGIPSGLSAQVLEVVVDGVAAAAR